MRPARHTVTLVLLPGMDGTGTLFAPFIAALGVTVKTVVVRYPPQGALDYPACEALARQALPLRGRFVILGESFSGPVAISLAASQPKGLMGLVLCATFASNPYPIFKPFANLTRLLPIKAAPASAMGLGLLGRFATPELLAALQSALAAVSTTALHARMRAVLSVDVHDQLRDVAVPALYLRAAHDRVVPARAAQHIGHVCSQATIVDIDAPHFILQAAPGPAADAVQTFLHAIAA